MALNIPRFSACQEKAVVPKLIFLLTLILTTCANSAVITLQAGDDIQAAVDAAPEGALFVLEPGIYRQQRFTPKDRQQFTGQPGAILNGAMLLTDWRNHGDYWIEPSVPEPLQPRGRCRGGGDLCKHREDLFIDGKLYPRVATLEDLGPGMWMYLDGAAYLTDDPSGHLVELSVIPRAVGGDAVDVVLRNLIVEKYASAPQRGAIDARDSRGWQVIDVTARWNHGIGIYIGDGMLVLGGSYSRNGQMGMGGAGDGALIENVEIAYNNYSDFKTTWEAGGAKFVRSNGLIIRNNCVHHNDGNGLWTDIDNINVLIEGNKVFDNAGTGIMHEISYKAIIRNNTIARNGHNKYNWLWGSQILVQNSQDVEVYGNLIEIAPDFGNGIGIIHQDRGTGLYGPYLTTNNNVHHNRVVHTGANGISGVAVDFDRATFWNQMKNRFRQNTYISPSDNIRGWGFENRELRWEDVQARGSEENSILTVATRVPMVLFCGTPG